jgi:hypothetical protein
MQAYVKIARQGFASWCHASQRRTVTAKARLLHLISELKILAQAGRPREEGTFIQANSQKKEAEKHDFACMH